MTVFSKISLVLLLIGATMIASPATAADKNDRVALAKAEYARLFGDEPCPLRTTDPEFAAIRDGLIFGQVHQRGSLSNEQRMLVIIAVVATQNNSASVARFTKAALHTGVKPEAIKECLYQISPYIGIANTVQAITACNEVFQAQGIALPLEKQGTVSEENRFQEGLAVQTKIFGDAIATMHKNAPKGQEDIIIDHLSAWCFGDTYTRKVLDLKMRELLTFTAIATLGGCEPQVKAHAAANISVGNSKQLLVDTLTQMLPYIGYPRTLNALACVNEVTQ